MAVEPPEGDVGEQLTMLPAPCNYCGTLRQATEYRCLDDIAVLQLPINRAQARVRPCVLVSNGQLEKDTCACGYGCVRQEQRSTKRKVGLQEQHAHEEDYNSSALN